MTDQAAKATMLKAADYRLVNLARGERLTIRNTHGAHGVGGFIWRAANTSERLNVADTMKIQGSTAIGRGSALFSDMGRMLAVMAEDSCGHHDMLVGGSTRASAAAASGRGNWRPNARDHMRSAAAKLGLKRADLGSCIVFFAAVSVGDDGTIRYEANRIRPGTHVCLEALENVHVVLSNTVHPLAEAQGLEPCEVELIVSSAPASAYQERDAFPTVEQRRAFDNKEMA
ncbi:MAG: DUF1989 domain-containing protein [Phyllobacteriaceae bacterium]|jgi:uncharacterized protein YcgI (DUF1989 family)|nr:DUF1989 domain-containing protein [Phyllobacteriaceae bacterium]